MKATSTSVLLAPCLALMLLLASPVSADDHARIHTWGFEHGSLVPNWSFENEMETWRDTGYGGMTSEARKPTDSAPSGRFIGIVHGTHNGSGEISLLHSEPIPIIQGQPYTLSFFVSAFEPVGSPAVRFYKGRGAFIRSVNGSSYASIGSPDWRIYTMNFTPEEEETHVEIVLWRHGTASDFTGISFDDVALEEGVLDSSAIAMRRARYGYSVSFSDALGRTHQTHTRLPGSGDYRIEAAAYDSAGRPWKTFLPFAAVGNEDGSPTYHNDPLSGANTYYYYGSPTPGLGSNPYSEVRYAPEPGARVVKSAAPGYAWAMNEGRNSENGFYFVASLAIPGDIANPSTDNNEREYRLDWSRDEDSTFMLSWTNRKGQVVQSAQQADGGWAISKTDYYPAGPVRRVRTPLDTSGATFSEVRNYNAAGRLTSSFGPDRGLVKFWYNKRGMIRLSQDDLQREKSILLFTYSDYDHLGNLISTGEQMLPYSLPSQESGVDGNGEGYEFGRTENRGWLYGSLLGFETRTGLPIDSIPFSSVISFSPRSSALMAAWNRNPGSRSPGLSEKERMVVDFYEYDHRGNLWRQHKYMGAMKEHPFQTVEYAYDEADRPLYRQAYEDGTPMGMLLEQSYFYDALGRVSAITAEGDTAARYAYAPHGPLREVGLGRDGEASGATATYGYHVRGWTREVNVVRTAGGQPLWRQVLGYETPALEGDGVPDLTRAHYTGQIAQQLYHYSEDVPSPVRTVNYVYDRMGRLTTADYHQGTGLDSTGALALPLSLVDSDELDTRVAYDQNGRIVGKRSGGVSSADSARYDYYEDSYRLVNVSGRLSTKSDRDASRYQNFAYDAAGRMTQDLSKNLHIAYGDDGMPSEIVVRDGNHELALYPLYDAAGYRVSQVTVRRLAQGFPSYWVGTREGVESEGMYTAPSIEAALADANYRLNFLNYPAPDSLVLYVVPDSGVNLVMPDDGSEYTNIMKGDTAIPVLLRGAAKQGYAYSELMNERAGQPLLARHWISMGGLVTTEVTEVLNSASTVAQRRVVANIYGRSASIGRVVRLDDSPPLVQYYVKNHLGSTVRVVNADGSYATTPVFDYQPYGELQSIREDSLNPVAPKYTGKELDSTVNLYYFGARWYDAELGMWISPDPANDGLNPYGYVGGNPNMFIDPHGLWKVGLGISVGYTRRGGFSLGIGLGVEDVKLPGLDIDTYAGVDQNFGNGSTSYSAQVGGKACAGLCLGGGAGGSYNTKSGYSANTYGSVGVGFSGIGDAGVEVGTRQYWDKDLDYIGGDVYGEVNGNAYGNGAALGYSQGFGAIKSGYYGEISAGGMSVSYHSAYKWDYGGSTRVASTSYDSKKGASYNYLGKSLVGFLSSEKVTPGAPKNGTPTGWLGTNWCGSGGGGPSTGALDGACIAHDASYAAETQKGILAAMFNGNWALVAADFRLTADAFKSVPVDMYTATYNPFISGSLVGGAFAVLGTYKTASNIAQGVGY